MTTTKPTVLINEMATLVTMAAGHCGSKKAPKTSIEGLKVKNAVTKIGTRKTNLRQVNPAKELAMQIVNIMSLAKFIEINGSGASFKYVRQAVGIVKA